MKSNCFSNKAKLTIGDHAKVLDHFAKHGLIPR
jgi:hypothetical protein